MDNSEGKNLILDMKCVKLWCFLPKERDGDTWGDDTWKDASLGEQGVAEHSKGFGRVV